jgi:hypothetical protein
MWNYDNVVQHAAVFSWREPSVLALSLDTAGPGVELSAELLLPALFAALSA